MNDYSAKNGSKTLVVPTLAKMLNDPLPFMPI